MQDTVTIQFSDEDKLVVKTSLFDNYPSCPIRKMIEDFGSIPSDYIVSFDLMSLRDFLEIREVLRGKKLEYTLSLELWNKANHYGLTKDTCFAERHLLATKMEKKINQLEEFEAGVGSSLLVVSEEKYHRLKTKFEERKDIVPCCVLSSTEYNDVSDNKISYLRAIIAYDKVLISVNDLVAETTGKIDVNEMKHEVMFAPALQELEEDDDIRYEYIDKYKDIPIIIDHKEDKVSRYQVISGTWFHEKSLGNLFSSDPKRILRGVSDMMSDQEIIEADYEDDVGKPIYYKQYRDYSSKLKKSMFNLEVNSLDVHNLIMHNYEIVNEDIMKRIKALSCVYLYHFAEDEKNRGRLDTTSYYTTFCFVRV
jgi:hypothetical protein